MTGHGERVAMRIPICIILGLIRSSAAIGTAQDVVPPLGLSPSGDIDAAASPPVRIKHRSSRRGLFSAVAGPRSGAIPVR